MRRQLHPRICSECGVDLAREANHTRRCPYYDESIAEDEEASAAPEAGSGDE